MSLACYCCGKIEQVMKKCSRCSSVLYCSRNCQIKDWPFHKVQCVQSKDKHPETKEKLKPKDDVKVTETASTRTRRITPIDFQKAFDDQSSTNNLDINTECTQKGNSYLLDNQYYFDAPIFDNTQPAISITVRAFGSKFPLKIHETWNGSQVIKYLSHTLKIPLNQLTLIHKGKKVNRDNIKNVIANKAVFQALGEKAEDDSGVDKHDIEVILEQLGNTTNRNEAVQALKKHKDVVDAILEIAGK